MSASAKHAAWFDAARTPWAELLVLWDAALRWAKDGAMTSAAAIAFYTISSLGPMMVIALAVAGAVFGEKSADEAIYGQIAGLVGQGGARAIQGLIQSAWAHHEGWIAKTIAPVVIVISATGIFGEIQGALNTIWRYKTTSSSVLKIVSVRLKSFAIIMSSGFVLVVSLLVNAAVAAFGTFVFGDRQVAWFVWSGHTVVSLLITTMIFAAIFKILPDAEIEWRDAFVGAFVGAVLFTFGKFGIGAYLASTNVATSYGAAGTFILILMWVYYSSMMFLYGAEVGWLWRAHRKGERRGSID